MKKLLLLTLILLPIIAFAQEEKYTCFWGIEFGSSMEQVAAKIKKDHGLTPLAALTDRDMLVYTECKLAGNDASLIMFQFVDNKLYIGAATLTPTSEQRVFMLFEEIESSLVKKYGAPIKKTRSFLSPYKHGDGYETQAIKLDKVSYSDSWELGKAEGKMGVLLSITTGVDVMLAYRDVTLHNIAAEKAKSKVINEL